MKRINAIDGCNERDHELGFAIGLGTVESYFGRDVYEDRRRKYTDDESRIEDRTNLDTMDNVFCPECEKLLSKYESKYSQTYNLQFDKDLVENTKVSGQEAALFWLGVIWRLSVTKHYGVSLTVGFEEKLRQIVVSEDLSGSDIYYSLNYCKDYRVNNPTFALFDCSNDVALLIIDEFMLVIFNGESATQNDEEIWGMNYKCAVTELNNGSRPERIGLYPIHIFKQITDNIILRAAKRFAFRERFNTLHMRLFGFEMPSSIFQEVMTEIHKAKLADIYTVSNYARSIIRVIQAHSDIYKISFIDDRIY